MSTTPTSTSTSTTTAPLVSSDLPSTIVTLISIIVAIVAYVWPGTAVPGAVQVVLIAIAGLLTALHVNLKNLRF